ncbi:MAG TPA: methyltransferase domain-containing protein [Longimicrobiales bacterium]|nr:methyltransferase domain-containing protein [Longimicrobiales bacterium]
MEATGTLQAQAIDEERLNAFLGKFVSDLGAALHAPTVIIGERLGLYRALAEAGPLTAEQLAERTGTSERYVREWLAAQAASGYVTYDPESARYSLTPEQAYALADETSPAYVPGAFLVAASVFADQPKLVEAFRTGAGVGWHEHHHHLFEGTERFFRSSYVGNLIQSWLPSLDGVVAKLERGARVADVGCGHGASTLLMARAYPESSFVGFDYHEGSIQAAQRAAEKEGLSDRVRFEVASSTEFPGKGYDLVAFFDCLHDMGDPAGAAAHVRRSLAKDGTWMIVEPQANERLEDNLNPVGRVFYSASTMICTPNALSQNGGEALGAQVPESRWRQIILGAGFRSFRRATETPFNRVFEARP